MTPTEPPLYRPMLAVSVPEPFDDPNFSFEVKWDGFRALAYLDRRTRLVSRNGIDLTGRFPELTLLHQAAITPAVVDGEIVALVDGRPNFARLLRRSRGAAPGTVPLVFIAFDLLHADDGPLLNRPLVERRALLVQRLDTSSGLVRVSEAIPERGRTLFEAACRMELEGIVGKRMSSPYRPGRRSDDWRKVRALRSLEAWIGGIVRTSPDQLGSVAIGDLAGTEAKGGGEQGLVYLGHVGSGLGAEAAADILRLAKPGPCPFHRVPREAARRTEWVLPRLRCRVEFLAFTDDGRLRHPVWRGLVNPRGE